VKRVVDGAFPPVDYASAQREALQRSMPGLAGVASPSLLLNVPAAELEKAVAEQLKTADIKGLTVDSVKTEAGNQGLSISANVSGNLTEPKGRFTAAVKGWVAVSLTDNVANLQPGLAEAKLTSLDLDGWFSFGDDAAASAINSVLKSFITNANSKFKPIEYKLDLRQAGLSTEPIVVKVTEKRSVTLPAVKLGGTAVLVSPLGMHMIADIAGTGAPTPVGACDKYECYAEAFWAKADTVKPGLQRGTAGIFVADSFVSEMFTPAFPPISLASLQSDALNALLGALNFNGQVALGASISAPRLKKALHESLKSMLPPTKEAKFGEPAIELGEQTIEVEVPISGIIDSANIGYKGKVRAGGVIAATTESLYYRVAVVGLQLEFVEHTGGYLNASAFVGSVNDLIAQLLPHVNGALDNQPIALPLPKIKPVPVAIKGVTITPGELIIPPQAGVIVIPRLDKSGLRVLVVQGVGVPGTMTTLTDVPVWLANTGDLKPRHFMASLAQYDLGSALMASAKESGESPKDLANKKFQEMWSSALPDQALWSDGLPAIRVAASTAWIVNSVSSVLQYNKIAINIPFDSGNTHFDTGKIRLAGGLQATCAAERTCTRNDCPLPACNTNSCNWNCARKVGFITTDDPFCKSGETLCNLNAEKDRGACNIRANADQAACNAREEGQRAACNIRKEAEIGLCKVAKEAVAAIKSIDGIGTANGDVRATGGVAIRLPVLKFDRGSSVASLEMSASADIKLAGDIYFTPYDIGHILACPYKGRAAIEVRGSIPMTAYRIESSIKDGGKGEDGSHKLELSFNQIPVRGRLSPAPVDALLSQNPQIFVTCSPVLAGSLATAALLGKIQAFSPGDILGAIEKAIPGNQDMGVAALKAAVAGQMDVSAPIPSFQVSVPELEAVIPGGKVTLQGEWKDGTLMFAGN